MGAADWRVINFGPEVSRREFGGCDVRFVSPRGNRSASYYAPRIPQQYMSAITAGWLYLGWGAVLFETNYGLMQHSPSEIKEKLLKALDKEYNVVDMAAVLEIVTILERTPITKEALETTRLGRDINELRRKTKNESLAKRAKDLVRRWRDLILPQNDVTPNTETQQNGAAKNAVSSRVRAHPISPAISLPNSDKSSVSPALPNRGDAVPKTHAANKRLRKEVTSPSITKTGPLKVDPSPELPTNKKLRVESPVPSIQENSQRVNGDHYDSVGSDCEIISVTPAQPKQRNRKKAPKDRTTKDLTGDVVKEKIASIARIPKVKTTQELLAGLQSRCGDTQNCAIPVVDHDVARNKTEHIARFLRSQGDEDDVIEVIDNESEVKNEVEVETEVPKEIEVKEEKPRLQTAEEILSRLPPLDLDAIDWEESPVPSPIPKDVTDKDIDCVLNQHIEGLNGNRDEQDKDSDVFREWHEVVSRTSYEGELLHILPYVVID